MSLLAVATASYRRFTLLPAVGVPQILGRGRGRFQQTFARFASVNCPTAATLPYARQRCMNDRPGEVGTSVRTYGKRTDG